MSGNRCDGGSEVGGRRSEVGGRRSEVGAAAFQYSSIPVFQYPSTPVFHFPSIPLPQYSHPQFACPKFACPTTTPTHRSIHQAEQFGPVGFWFAPVDRSEVVDWFVGQDAVDR